MRVEAETTRNSHVSGKLDLHSQRTVQIKHLANRVPRIRTLAMKATLALALALSVLAVAAAGEGHDHGGTMAFEWGGIFDTPNDSYTWAAQAVKEGEERAYVDPAMTMVAYGFDAAATADLFESKEEDADTKLEGTCTDVLPGGTIKADGTCYNLKFQASTLDSTFTVDTTAHKA